MQVCVDSVARAPVQNIVQFNGYFGCSWCLEPGERPEDSNVHVYRYKEKLAPRTNKEHKEHAAKAEASRVAIYGVKGSSVLSQLPDFDIIFNFVFDCMHAIDLGIIRQLFGLWFDSKNFKEKFYIGSSYNKNLINSRLANLTVPTNITRLPRSLKESNFWKASEWRNCLLYYFPFILRDILQPAYFKHFMLLSEAAFILNGTSISQQDLFAATRRLNDFVKNFEGLYRESALSFNLHILLHACQCVSRWGPLWAYSAYGFEDCNGVLLNLFNGTQSINTQITKNFLHLQKLKAYTYKFFDENTNVNLLNIQTKLLGGYVPVKRAIRADDCVFVGSPILRDLTREEQYLAKHSYLNTTYSHGSCYQKLITNNDVFNTHSYQRSERRKNCFVLISEGRLCRLSAIIVLDTRDGKKSILFGHWLKHIPVSSPTHLLQLVKIDCIGPLVAFHPSEIVSKCVVLASESNSESMYLSVLTNMLDRD